MLTPSTFLSALDDSNIRYDVETSRCDASAMRKQGRTSLDGIRLYSYG